MEEKSLGINDIQTGYVIALLKNGEISFKVIGEVAGIVELAGLNQVATTKINIALAHEEQEADNQKLYKALEAALATIKQMSEVIKRERNDETPLPTRES